MKPNQRSDPGLARARAHAQLWATTLTYFKPSPSSRHRRPWSVLCGLWLKCARDSVPRFRYVHSVVHTLKLNCCGSGGLAQSDGSTGWSPAALRSSRCAERGPSTNAEVAPQSFSWTRTPTNVSPLKGTQAQGGCWDHRRYYNRCSAVAPPWP